jgi:hypothetical protein
VRRAVAFVALAGVVWIPKAAHALDAEVEALALGQFYGLRSITDETLAETRFSQSLRVNLFNIAPENKLYFVSHLRLDANTALTETETAQIGVISEYQRATVALLVGYLAGKNLWKRVDFGLGRQLSIDALDYFVYDGLRIAVNTPWHFGVEALAGFQVRGASALGFSAFQPWGTLESEDMGAAPVFGVAIYARDVAFGGFRTAGRAAWRRVFGGAIIEERVGAHVEQTLAHVVTLNAGATYNLVFDGFDEVTAGARVRLAEGRLQIAAEYFRATPRFDADSIWNVFSTYASDDVRAKVSLEVSESFELFARALVRFFSNRVDPTDAVQDATVSDRGGAVGARYLSRTTGALALELGGEASLQAGWGGDRIAADAYAIVSAWQRRILVQSRLTFVNVTDDIGAHRTGNYFGFVLGATYRILRGTSLGVICETLVNDSRNLFRLYVALESSLTFWDDPVDMNRARAVGTTP